MYKESERCEMKFENKFFSTFSRNKAKKTNAEIKKRKPSLLLKFFETTGEDNNKKLNTRLSLNLDSSKVSPAEEKQEDECNCACK